MYYIDKTECLEKGIVVFPFIYIMGASVVGKSAAIQRLREKHPEVKVHMVDMHHGQGQQMSAGEWKDLLAPLQVEMAERPCWLVLENVPRTSVTSMYCPDWLGIWVLLKKSSSK